MRILAIVILCLNTLFSSAQDFFPKDYFMFPLKPGQINYLSANMGELRPNHFHAGIDVKTDLKTGLPVYASADGYVSRIKISSYGYGKVIYITHPNTLTTVYAHLDVFNNTIAEYTLKKHYELQAFEIDYYPAPNELLIKKGEQIGLSGNSGSSGGPHLHYEIRDAQEKVLNPLLFGFSEIKDNLSPVFDKIAIRTFETDSRVNNEFGLMEFTPVKIGNTYTLSSVVKVNSSIGIELKVHDLMNGTYNSYGVSCLELQIDGKEHFYHNLKSFAFDESRYINVHIDYEKYIQNKVRLEKCFIDDGNKLDTYKREIGNGRILIQDTLTHEIQINVFDAYGNSSTMKFNIKGESPKNNITATGNISSGFNVQENILKITTPTTTLMDGKLYLKGKEQNLTPAYHKLGHNIYLYDLRKGIPDSFAVASYKEIFDFVATIPPGKEYNLKFKNLSLSFADTTLFDTLYLRLQTNVMEHGAETFQIHNSATPIYGRVKITYCPHHAQNRDEKCYFYSVNGSSHSFEGGDWDEDQENIIHNIKYLGTYTVKKDTVGPVIKLKSISSESAKFSIFDTGSGVESYRATLNGEWILMNFDHKTSSLWSERLDKTKPMKGLFELEVTDGTGNTTVYKQELL